ncbi:MAG: hypothetical protein M1819_001299 [Sarea resinae]|nr:MAG: hypothetical protein M1819_001299 [Sarea resinae]
MLLRFACALFAVGSLLLDGVSAGADKKFAKFARRGPHQAEEMVRDYQHRRVAPRSSNSTLRFYNNNTSKYFVDSLPDVNFDLGELYSGLVPIDKSNASRALFFAFQPTIGEPVDEITIWLNGGPGCSSLEGFFQENGRWTWQPGTFAPVENPYSWVNLTNMLWVEQPVGTGFSIGEVTASTEEEIAQDFVKFFKNFQETFGISNFKIYVSGESYAGMYVPYISAAMLDQNNTKYFDLKGALVYDPVIGTDYAQETLPTVPFVVENNNLFKFNDSFISELQALDESCGYADYRNKYFTFPASGVQPDPVNFAANGNQSCDVFDLVNDVAFSNNPCFNIYAIEQMCPLLWDVLSFPTELTYTPAGATTYFNRSDVKAAIHAPSDVDWVICGGPVFVGADGDTSAPPIEAVLPQVIEATNRVLVGNGDLDMIILTNGTLLSIQNMTWNNGTGFKSQPVKPINIQLPDLQYESVFDAPENQLNGLDGPQGIMGIQHFERGLMWAETYLSGHMQPEFQPRVTYRHLEWLLGRVNEI